MHPPYAGEPPPASGQGVPAYCYRHPDRATGLSCTRCGRPICPECLSPAPVGFHCPNCVAEGRASVRQPSALRTAIARSRTRPTVTYTLVGLNVLMYMLTLRQLTGRVAGLGNELYFNLAMWGPAVDVGEYWRLISSTFLHNGLTHIAVNMLSLFLIGPGIEQFLGRWRYLAVYLLAGLGGSITVWIFTPNVVAAGASGAIFGLLGAAAIVMIRNKQNLRPLIGVLLLNLVISLFPGISLAAHAGGLVVGALATFLLLTFDKHLPAGRR